MIRAFIAGCRFALMLLAVLVAIEVTIAVAEVGGWLRFVVALLVASIGLVALARSLAAAEEQQWRTLADKLDPHEVLR